MNNNADELLAELLADDNTERLKARLAAKSQRSREIVTVRVTKLGDGKLFTGEHDPLTAEAFMRKRGDVFTVERRYAEGFEERGFAEIEEPLPVDLVEKNKEPGEVKKPNVTTAAKKS